MILVTHAVVGASIANVLPAYSALAFATGFASHFLLDAIPHRDYHLSSVYQKSFNNSIETNITTDKKFLLDLIKISIDFFSGIIIVWWLFGASTIDSLWIPFWGMIGGVTPDALQFVYFKWKHEPIISLQKIHFWFHTKYKLEDWPVFVSILSQALIALLFVTISKLLSS